MSPSVPASASEPAPHLFDVRAVAACLRCSVRHVYRMSDAGRMPAPVKFGALVRWRRADIERWLNEGCPAVRKIPSR
jgi:excisionase family DNA binding protein